jgi:hypothetical protein
MVCMGTFITKKGNDARVYTDLGNLRPSVNEHVYRSCSQTRRPVSQTSESKSKSVKGKRIYEDVKRSKLFKYFHITKIVSQSQIIVKYPSHLLIFFLLMRFITANAIRNINV